MIKWVEYFTNESLVPRPPSTGKFAPVIKLLKAFDDKNTMDFATSSASPALPRAWVAFEFSKNLHNTRKLLSAF